MSTDYEAITRYNEEQLGKDTASRKSQVNMYSDFSHFVYEILQNADDHDATTITFNLAPEELKIEYNGIPFIEEHVKAISYFGKSTSRDDLIKTGQFGLGFKSVFAFTATPAIYSGEEDFQIYGLYRLKALPRPADLEPEKTRICLPFNHAEERPDFVETLVLEEKAFNKISRRLKKLDIATLLFTRNLSEIKWTVQDEEGHYLRGDKHKKNISEDFRARKTEITNGDLLHTYLVFSRSIEWHGKEYKPVEIAFFLDDSNKVDRIRSIKKPLFVLFPTTQETKMGFLINGPFRTPAHRETVSQDDEFNQFLVKKVASLICDALPKIREMGLLTVSFLETLPIRMDDFPEEGMLFPIVEAVRDALVEQELLPADDGTFVSARNAKLSSADWLRKLVTSDQLRDLFSSKYQLDWLSSEITQKRTSDLRDYLINELDVEEVTPDSFTSRIEETFLAKQNDKWIIDFYKCLNKVPHLWDAKHHPLLLFRSKPIIKTEDDKLIAPYSHKHKYYSYGSYITENRNDVFLPPEGETSFTIVKRCVAADDEARQFLINLGLKEPDIYDEIYNKIFPKYDSDSDISPEEHKRHIDTVLRAIRSGDEAKRNKLIEKIKSLKFILAINSATNDSRYEYPSNLYFKTDDLKTFFEGNSDVWFIDEELSEKFKTNFPELGVSDIIRIENRTRDNLKENRIIWERKHKIRGVNGFDYRCKINGLEYALNNPVFEKSKFIWNNLLRQHIDSIKGMIESKEDVKYVNADFVADKSEVKYSLMGQLLIEKPWLPDEQGIFHKPGELGLDDLPDTFQRNEKLADQLGMKKDVVAKLAEEAGVSVDGINLLKQLEKRPDVYEKIKADILPKEKKAEFPEKILKNAERRKGKIIQKYRDAPKKKYEKKKLGKRTTENTIDPRTWLRETYTNKKGQMICQICQEEMPFKKRNGEYYFEAIELLNDFDREMEELHIALCPLCAAMYNEFVKHDEGAMESLKNTLMDLEDVEVPLQLGELDTSIRFVESHWRDIRTILQEMG